MWYRVGSPKDFRSLVCSELLYMSDDKLCDCSYLQPEVWFRFD